MTKPFVQPSVNSASHSFAQVPSADVPRSKFDRSHAYKTTLDEAGYLYPVYVDEVLPGDTFKMNSTVFGRLATPLRPVMDNMYMDIQYWFVPNRLVWDDWQKFMGERKNPNDNPDDYSVPSVYFTPPENSEEILPNMLYDYFGLPARRRVETSPEEMVNILPFRAYYLIWNEWYRDQNLQDSISVNTGMAGTPYAYSDDINGAKVVRRGKRHDYFTSCLPWPQKGDPVDIPLNGQLPVFGFDNIDTQYNHFALYNNPLDPEQGFANADIFLTGTGTTNAQGVTTANPAANRNLFLNPDTQVGVAQLEGVTGITVNDLRTAFQVQKLLERDARGGTRYIELIMSHFGVRSDDARLQRPEYLGGSSARININPLASTATVPDTAPQANLSGVGTTVNRANFNKSFTEHGYIIGLASVRADLTYQQGLDRMWSRSSRYDFYWPALSHLGEQAVYKKELHFTGVKSQDDQVFGYQERYAEYRYKNSSITGKFRSLDPQSLDTWHLSQEFDIDGDVNLNSDFIQENPPIERIIAVPSEPHFLLDIWFDLKCDRPMPIYAVPGLIDHF